MAIEMLQCYIEDLGSAFHSFVDQVLSLVVPLLTFYFHDGVRYASSSCIPLLFACLLKANYCK